jgi:hypothetical protein
MAISLDLCARRVVMASMAYYGLDEPVMTDADYDSSCLRLAEQWAELQPIRKWQLGSAEAISTTGNHVRVTTYAEHGLIVWMEELGLLRGRRCHRTKRQTFNKTHGVHWNRAGEYQWSCA